MKLNITSDPFIDNGICQGRLTLTSGTPITTADVTAAGTLYFTPYKGNRIALYNGSWKEYKFSELSLSLTLTSGKPYDIFIYDNAGVLTLESLVWTNDTTRATALVLQDGVYVKTGATTRRYLGSIYASGTNTTEDSLVKRYVWNAYNRVRKPMRATLETSQWNYTTDTWRQANANTANQLDMIRGLDEDSVYAQVQAMSTNGSSVSNSAGIGLSSTTANSAYFYGRNAGTNVEQHNAIWDGFPGVGRRYLVWLERSAATGTTVWYGDAGDNAHYQCGIMGNSFF